MACCEGPREGQPSDGNDHPAGRHREGREELGRALEIGPGQEDPIADHAAERKEDSPDGNDDERTERSRRISSNRGLAE